MCAGSVVNSGVRGRRGRESLTSKVGVRSAERGVRTLDFGLWTLDFGLWTLDFRLLLEQFCRGGLVEDEAAEDSKVGVAQQGAQGAGAGGRSQRPHCRTIRITSLDRSLARATRSSSSNTVTARSWSGAS